MTNFNTKILFCVINNWLQFFYRKKGISYRNYKPNFVGIAAQQVYKIGV